MMTTAQAKAPAPPLDARTTDAPFFSIVIPTYNHGHYIARAIDSVLAQDGSFEVIVVDDGSTDDTPQRLAAYEGRIRATRTVNRGAPAARNTGIAAARGRYVVLLDADDRLLPGSLAAFRETLAVRPELELICGGHVSVTNEGRRKARPAPNLTENQERDFVACVYGEVEIQNGAAAIERGVFTQAGFAESLRSCDDIIFYARLVAGRRCASIDRSIVEKFAHPGRLRDDYETVVRDCRLVTDLLFDARALPPALMSHRRAFHARQLLTEFRAHYRNHEPRRAAVSYLGAVRVAPWVALRWASFRKFVRCLPAAIMPRGKNSASRSTSIGHVAPPNAPTSRALQSP